MTRPRGKSDLLNFFWEGGGGQQVPDRDWVALNSCSLWWKKWVGSEDLACADVGCVTLLNSRTKPNLRNPPFRRFRRRPFGRRSLNGLRAPWSSVVRSESLSMCPSWCHTGRVDNLLGASVVRRLVWTGVGPGRVLNPTMGPFRMTWSPTEQHRSSIHPTWKWRHHQSPLVQSTKSVWLRGFDCRLRGSTRRHRHLKPRRSLGPTPPRSSYSTFRVSVRSRWFCTFRRQPRECSSPRGHDGRYAAVQDTSFLWRYQPPCAPVYARPWSASASRALLSADEQTFSSLHSASTPLQWKDGCRLDRKSQVPWQRSCDPDASWVLLHDGNSPEA